jgi:hexosaminidase
MPTKNNNSIIPLNPHPQEIEFKEGTFIPRSEFVFIYDEDLAELRQIANTSGIDLEIAGFTVSPTNSTSSNNTCKVNLVLRDDSSLGEEGYRLIVGLAISIAATTTRGLFWGTRTLLQLLHAGPNQEVPYLVITDRPEFEYRGVMIDNARNFHSLEFHIETIKKMSSFKLNKYQIHFSDNESYTLPSSAFPSLPTPDKHYTTDQIKQLVKVANDYHITIVPEIDVPGHAKALTLSMKQLACSDTPTDTTTGKLCIGSEHTYDTLETLFTEVMDMIPGDYWHLGADEVGYDDQANCTCRECLKRMKIESLNEGDQLYHYFINRMHNFVKNNDRKMLVWEGFKPTGNPRIAKDIIVCPFDVKHKGCMPENYFDAGYRVLNTSWTPLYIADKIYMTTPEIMARWSPYMFGAGRSPQPYAYWKKFAPKDLQKQIIGAQICTWDIEEKAEAGLLFGTGPGYYDYGRPGPRVQIMAERIWTGSHTPAKELLERLGQHYWQASF